MAKGPVRPDCTVARYCNPVWLANGRITSAAFQPRPVDMNRLSTSCIECQPDSDFAGQLKSTIRCMKECLRSIDPKGVFSLLSVRAINEINVAGQAIQVRKDPSKCNKCHAVILTKPAREKILDAATDLSDLANRSTSVTYDNDAIIYNIRLTD